MNYELYFEFVNVADSIDSLRESCPYKSKDEIRKSLSNITDAMNKAMQHLSILIDALEDSK